MTSLKKDLESRLDTIGWGVFFIMSGAMLLVPNLPQGSFAIGIGAILLGFSAARFALELPVSTFALICGLVAVAAGLGATIGVAVPWFAMFLLMCGFALVAGDLARRPARA